MQLEPVASRSVVVRVRDGETVDEADVGPQDSEGREDRGPERPALARDKDDVGITEKDCERLTVVLALGVVAIGEIEEVELVTIDLRDYLDVFRLDERQGEALDGRPVEPVRELALLQPGLKSDPVSRRVPHDEALGQVASVRADDRAGIRRAVGEGAADHDGFVGFVAAE